MRDHLQPARCGRVVRLGRLLVTAAVAIGCGSSLPGGATGGTGGNAGSTRGATGEVGGSSGAGGGRGGECAGGVSGASGGIGENASGQRATVDSHFVAARMRAGWLTIRCQTTAHSPSVCGVIRSGETVGMITHAS